MKTATVYTLGATKDDAEKACAAGAFQPTKCESLKVLEGLREKFPTGFEHYRVWSLKITVEAFASMGVGNA
jgi:molybdopterin-biosynthesis enzyme MoeA-like protein